MNIRLFRRRHSVSGGAERFTQRMARLLSGKGHAVTIVAEQWPLTPEDHYQVQLVNSHSPETYAQRCLKEFGNRKDAVNFSLERTLKQDFYRAGDGVHACWLDRRSFFKKGWWDRLSRWMPKHRSVLRLEKAVFSPTRTGRIITNSAMVKSEILDRFAFPSERICVVHPGVNLTTFKPCLEPNRKIELRVTFAIPRDAIVWGFVGSGFERKGLLWAIQIASRQKTPIYLLVLGRGNQREAQHLAAQEGFLNRLIFAPGMTPALDVYHASDAFILPTIYDPCSNATLEAAACGLPVITTEGNGAKEFVPSLILKDPSQPDPCAEQSQTYAKPLTLSPELTSLRTTLDETECWRQMLDQITHYR